MKVKQFFSGLTAFIFAITIVFGFHKQPIPEGAYHVDPNDDDTCIAVFTPCDLTGNEECTEPLGEDEEEVRIHQNIGSATQQGQTTKCGLPLWRLSN